MSIGARCQKPIVMVATRAMPVSDLATVDHTCGSGSAVASGSEKHCAVSCSRQRNRNVRLSGTISCVGQGTS